VLLLHFCHILLEVRWSLRLGFHKVDLGVSRVVVGKHNNILVAVHRLSLHWANHIGVNQLSKSSLCLVLRGLERLPEHLAQDSCLTSTCRLSLSMQLDTFDCIREPFDSWEGEVAEGSMPNKNLVMVNRGPIDGLGLGGLGDGAESCARLIIYYYRGFRD